MCPCYPSPSAVSGAGDPYPPFCGTFLKMKIRAYFAILALATLLPVDAEAGIILYDNFNQGGVTGTQSAANTALLFTPTSGNGMLSSNFDPVTITDFAGTTNNAQNGDTAGVALALQNGTANENAGKYLQISTSTVGNTNIQLSFAIQATATGFQSDQLQYSTDGVTFLNFAAAFTPISSGTGFSAAGGLQSFDLSSITALNNDASAAFRIVFSLGNNPTTGAPNAGSSTGNNRIDNLLVSGTPAGVGMVPEPASAALLGLGLIGGLIAARRLKRPA